MSDFFATLGPAGTQRILSMMQRRAFERMEHTNHGPPGAHTGFHIIESGWFLVRLLTTEGRPMGMTIEGPGSVFGELTLLSRPNRFTVTARALLPGVTLSFDPAHVGRVRTVVPEVDQALVALLAARVELLTAQLAEAAGLSTRTRLCRLLLHLHEVFDAGPIHLTQAELASLVHSTRQTVSTLLSGLNRDGLLTTGRGRITVRRPDGLERLIATD